MGQDEDDSLPGLQPGWCWDEFELGIAPASEREHDEENETHGARAGGWPKGKAKGKAKTKAMAKAKTRLRPTGAVVVKEMKPKDPSRERAARTVAQGKVQVLGDSGGAAQQVSDTA